MYPLQQRIVRFLTDFGKCKVVPHKCKTYKNIKLKPPGRKGYFFVGRYGQVRIGTSVSASKSVTVPVQEAMFKWEDVMGLSTIKPRKRTSRPHHHDVYGRDI